MQICGACRRHVRATESECPFCGNTLRDDSGNAPFTKLMNLVGGAVTTIVLTACYGGFDDDYKDTGLHTGDTTESGETGLLEETDVLFETGDTDSDFRITGGSGGTGLMAPMSSLPETPEAGPKIPGPTLKQRPTF